MCMSTARPVPDIRKEREKGGKREGGKERGGKESVTFVVNALGGME